MQNPAAAENTNEYKHYSDCNNYMESDRFSQPYFHNCKSMTIPVPAPGWTRDAALTTDMTLMGYHALKRFLVPP